MALPATLAVLSHEVTVTLVQDLRVQADRIGGVNLDGGRIVIDAEAPPSAQRETLMHELFEVLNYRLELGMKHRQITALSEGLVDTLVRNPALLEAYHHG